MVKASNTRLCVKVASPVASQPFPDMTHSIERALTTSIRATFDAVAGSS